jgi:dTDP-3-amino-3,4,6-trideoxy-alpha-D-glucose transaminase
MTITLFETASQLEGLREQILERIASVVAGGHFILGPEVEAFEQELAAYVGVEHAIGVANGTDALTIAARSLGVGPADEVVLPSFTFYATAEAIANAGARPVFCDVDHDTRNVTPETVAAALTPRTRAIVAVDLFGNPAPVAALRALGVPVIEDAAQALGASLEGRRAGSLGDIATVSFYPSKNLGAFGDGGAILTDSDEFARAARALRFHGSRDKRTFEYVGYNSRLDELQAAILRVLLPHLDEWCRGRQAAAALYAGAGIAEYVGVTAPTPGAQPAWHLYVVTHRRAEELQAALKAAHVQSRGYYRTPLHRQPAMAPFAAGGPPLPVTDELARANLALPMSATLTAQQAQNVTAAIAAFLAREPAGASA